MMQNPRFHAAPPARLGHLALFGHRDLYDRCHRFASDDPVAMTNVSPPMHPTANTSAGSTRGKGFRRRASVRPITQGSLADTKLSIRDWQRDFLEAIYTEDDNRRRPVRTAVLSMARKNGKTPLVAGLGLSAVRD